MTLKEGKGEGERETGVLLLCWMSRREEVYGQEEDEQLPLRRREGRAGARTATGADLDDVLLCPPYPSSPFSVLCNFLLPTSSWPSATRRLVNKTGRCPAPANGSDGRRWTQTKQSRRGGKQAGRSRHSMDRLSGTDRHTLLAFPLIPTYTLCLSCPFFRLAFLPPC